MIKSDQSVVVIMGLLILLYLSVWAVGYFTGKVRKLLWNSIVVIIQKNFSGNIFFAWRYLRQIKIKYIACCHRFHNMTCCKGKTTNFIFVT